MKKNEIRGYLYILIGTTLWGVSSVVAKSLFIIGLPPAELVQIRLTLATFTLLLILILFDRKRIIISLKDLPYFLVLGFVGVAGVQFTYYYTISKIHVGPAVLIQYSRPNLDCSLCLYFSERTPHEGKDGGPSSGCPGMLFHCGGISNGSIKIKPDWDCERLDLFPLLFFLRPLWRKRVKEV